MGMEDANYFVNMGKAGLSRIAGQDEQKAKQEELNQQKAQMMAQYGEGSRGALAKQISGIRSGMSSRGLLYSGLRQGAEQEAQGQSAAQSADYQARLNQSQADKMGEFQQEAANQGLQQYQDDTTQAFSDYSNAIAKRKQRSGLMGQLGSGIGALAGAAASAI